MKISRRNLLKLGCAGAAGAAAVAVPGVANASAASASANGLLIDTTRCVGCRACEAACSESNALPAPAGLGDRSVLESKRVTDTQSFTVVNGHTDPKDGSKTFVKSQCMHCVEPACASVCLARALDKTPEGPVVYHKDRCLGCRYCMQACPFEVPRFEYDSPAPYIKKCLFCAEKQKAGEAPACAGACPSGALQFGKRDELIEEAKRRIYQNPGQYVPHVYGEREVGGTSMLYLADKSFDKLGMRTDLGETGYPEFTKGALGLVPFVVTLWPPLLMGLHTFSKSREQASEQANEQAPHPEESSHE